MKIKLLRKIRKRFSVNHFNDKWHIIDFKDGQFIVKTDTLSAATYMVNKLGYKNYSKLSMLRRKTIIDIRIDRILNRY